MTEDETLPFGQLGRAHGVRGEISLRPFNPGGLPLEQLATPFRAVVVSGAGPTALSVVQVRPAGDHYLVRFDGVTSREAAAALTNREVRLARDLFPPLDEGEVFIQDLIGCAVVDESGRPRGIVKESFWNGAHDVLTIEDGSGEQLLVPAVPEFVLEVDLDARRILVNTHE
jgi:16S rRNA processing protein RimM